MAKTLRNRMVILIFVELMLSQLAYAQLRPLVKSKISGEVFRPFVITGIDSKDSKVFKVTTQDLKGSEFVSAEAKFNCGEESTIDLSEAKIDRNRNYILFKFKSKTDCEKLALKLRDELKKNLVFDFGNSIKEGEAVITAQTVTPEVKEHDPKDTIVAAITMKKISAKIRKLNRKSGSLATHGDLDDAAVIEKLDDLNNRRVEKHFEFNIAAQIYLDSLTDKNQNNTPLENQTKRQILLERHLAPSDSAVSK